MNKILCSTGTFIGTVNDFDYKLIPEYSGKLNCDGFEMMIEPFWDTAEQLGEIADYLARFNLNFETLHADKSTGDLISRNESGDLDEALRRFELNCGTAEKIGAKLIVLHLWGGRASDKNIDFNIKVFADLLEIAYKYNVTITVENVVCNQRNALGHLCRLYEIYGDNAKFIIDVRHAEFHKNLKETCETEYLWKNVLHTHISDYKGGYMDWTKLRPVLRPGTGDVDFTYFFEFLKKIKYKGSFALEAGARNTDRTAVDFEKINESLDFIYKNIRE
jgi:sugar phosphate isomerase/epimerase